MDSREINPWNVPVLSHDLQRQLVVILQTFQSERDTYDYMLPIYIPIPKVADELDLLAQEDLFCKTTSVPAPSKKECEDTAWIGIRLVWKLFIRPSDSDDPFERSYGAICNSTIMWYFQTSMRHIAKVEEKRIDGTIYTTPASWKVDDSSAYSEVQNVWNQSPSDTLADQSVFFTRNSQLLANEDEDSTTERLIICAFYDRAVWKDRVIHKLWFIIYGTLHRYSITLKIKSWTMTYGFPLKLCRGSSLEQIILHIPKLLIF